MDYPSNPQPKGVPRHRLDAPFPIATVELVPLPKRSR